MKIPILVEVEERFSDDAEVQRHRMTFASNALVHTLNTILMIYIHWQIWPPSVTFFLSGMKWNWCESVGRV